MLTLLINHIAITFICIWVGFLFYSIVTKIPLEKPTVYYLVTGFICLTTISQIIVLFMPLTVYVFLPVMFLVAVSVVTNWQRFLRFCTHIIHEINSLLLLQKLLFILVWLVILLINAGPILMDDTESYHIQSIKWIQEYGSVPGLVNLHERFGFNSSWFSSIALFNFFSKTTGGFTALNSVLSVWLSYWFISKFNQCRTGNSPTAAFGILATFIAGLVVWPIIRGNAATTNYDFITTCVVVILFAEIFLSTDRKISPSIEWILWPAYLFTVKIINFPLLLLSLFAVVILIKQKNIKAALLPIAYCLLLIIPFLIRNIIIAGYPFYPVTSFNWFNVDWKPDSQITEKLLEYIKYYNRVSTTYLDIEQTKALGSAWMPSWFQYLFWYDKLLVLAGLGGILLTIARLFSGKYVFGNKMIMLLSVIIAWLAAWFIISPDPRFVYGVFLFGIFLLIYHFISLFKNFSAIEFLQHAIIILLVMGTLYYLISKPLKQTEYQNWVSPPSLPQPPVKEILIDSILFRIPQPINNNWNARCYGTDLPCLYKIDPRLKARGKNIDSGFRLEK